ncbi:MAG: DUF3782 domain-containing protein [Methylovulum sp.]|nr:MAG: DUF3782 domain-containing protein [Methylovulum sp.]
MTMTDDELKQLVASLAISQKETDKQFKETDKQFKETGKQFKETSKQLKELGKQIGGLGKKFGSFTEGLALPSMTKILRERFKMEVISPSVRVSKNGIDAEIDVLAYANSAINEVYVVEVKSHLREEAITQLNSLMANFKTLFPEHKDKKLYGIIAAVDMSEALKQRVLAAGFYMARIQDETFSLDVPDEFQAKCF